MGNSDLKNYIEKNETLIFHEKYGKGKIKNITADEYGKEWVDIEFEDKSIENKHWLLDAAIQQKLFRFLNSDAWLREYVTKIIKEYEEKVSQERKILQRERTVKEEMREKLRLSDERKCEERKAQLAEELYKENLSTIDELWQTLCDTSKSFQFLGFHHHADFEVFLKIWASGYLKSRNGAKNLGIVDVGDKDVIEHTDEEVKNCARLYCGPDTPTYYVNEGIKYGTYGAGHGNVPIPVALIFGKSILEEKGCKFSEGNAGSTLSFRTGSYKRALKFDWKTILSRGPHERGDSYTIRLRDGELLVKDEVSLKHLSVVAFRTEADKKHAEFLLGKNNLFHVLPEMFKSPDEIRVYTDETGRPYYGNTYLTDYRIRKENNVLYVDFEFIKPVDKYKHELKFYMKDGKVNTFNMEATGKSGTLKIVEEFDKIDHYEYLLNGNVSAIWR